MHKKMGKIASVIVIAGALLYCTYLTFTMEEPLVDSLRIFIPVACSSCMLLSHIFSTRQIQPLPKEILENEAYMKAKEQQDSGGKIFIAGIFMMGIPLILLFVLGELHDFLASICLLSFFLGILSVLTGVFVAFLATKDLAKFPIETVQDPQPESKVSRVFHALGLLLLIIWAPLCFLS